MDRTMNHGSVPKMKSALVLITVAAMVMMRMTCRGQHFSGVRGPSSQYVGTGRHWNATMRRYVVPKTTVPAIRSHIVKM